MKTLKPKDTGDDVRHLQELLRKYDATVNVNGTFDAETLNAVINFQKNSKLQNDGIVGYLTWEALLFPNNNSAEALSEQDFINIAALLDIEVAALKAVKEVETGRLGAFIAPGKPTILFEGHIFWSQLKQRGISPDKFAQGNKDILYPAADRSQYQGGLAEYNRLERAEMINREAALSSASWGMFQIMGFNHAACGVNNVCSFVEMMKQSETKQLLLSARFIHSKKEMETALRTKNWAKFAQHYNGPQYEQNQYDKKLAAAYQKYSVNHS
ncbi:N-acetylmuramidase domain-containing protein [Bacteroides sp.]